MRAATTPTPRPRPRAASGGWPYTMGGSLIAYRKSWFAEVGASGPPKIGTVLKIYET
jgi:hypothetical protein